MLRQTEKRLVTAKGDGKNVTINYDPAGRLFTLVANGVTTTFLYEGDVLLAEYNSSGGMLKRYVHGGGIDNPLFEYEGSSLTIVPFNRRCRDITSFTWCTR